MLFLNIAIQKKFIIFLEMGFFLFIVQHNDIIIGWNFLQTSYLYRQIFPIDKNDKKSYFWKDNASYSFEILRRIDVRS